VTLAVCTVAAASAGTAQAYVYWSVDGPLGSSGGGTTLGRANLDGGGVTHALVTGAANPDAIAVDGSHIYWVNASTKSIGRANLDGSGADPTWITPSVAPAGLAVDGSYIYWTDDSQYIGRASLDGTGVDAHFINTAPATEPYGIAVAPGTIYFGAAGEIASVPAGGGSPTVLTALDANTVASALAVANGYLYWASVDLIGPPSSAIDRIELSPPYKEDLNYIPDLWFPGGVATDGTYLYWSDDSPSQVEIGRALITTGSGASNTTYNFVSQPGGPAGVAVDAGIDPTQTSVSCTPASIGTGTPTVCTATVSDSASSAAPAGTVNLTGNGATFFSGNPCTLSAKPGGGASCVVGAVPTNAGTQTITASYSGDPVHSPSAGDIAICAGTPTQCGTQPTPPPPLKCVVPKLKRRTLTAARGLLSKAHCTLGKVRQPHAKKGQKLGTLVVGSQSPAAGKTLAAGSKVAVVLVKAPKPKKRRR